MRLLPTIRPHLLADHFESLCDTEIPCGPHVMEITRLCLPSRLGRDGRRAVRNRLISAMVDHALENGVSILRSEEHTSALQSLMSISNADFCQTTKNNTIPNNKKY